MKYKLLKLIESQDSIFIGNIFSSNSGFIHLKSGVEIPVELLIEQGFIEEIKEIPKPRWKVGDKVVVDVDGRENRYGIIEGIIGNYYRSCGLENYLGEKFRDPTQEELDTYFL